MIDIALTLVQLYLLVCVFRLQERVKTLEARKGGFRE